MKQIFLACLAVAVLSCGSVTAWAAVDHSELIKDVFNGGPDVTRKCLECHEDAAMDVMQTTHWTWSFPQVVNGRQVEFGKINAINNFCIAIRSNEPRCTSCHIGYGWKDAKFDFTDKSRVDCLICHDTTGTYKKNPVGAGFPYPEVDLLKVAQNVGKPTRANCGACHFEGGGGDAVKHGDLDSSLTNPTAALDIHMAKDGLNFSCQQCHVTTSHQIGGNAMVVSPSGTNHFNCERCHHSPPHKESRLNAHMARIACQTCHVPVVAKELPTKVFWDWSKAGQDRDVIPHDQYGKELFNKKKGEFTFVKNLVPAYAWYNHQAGVYLAGDKIDPDTVNVLSWPKGDIKDNNAKIYPFKIHNGVQPYDKVNNILIIPKLFGKTGFWKHYDWNKAAALGMEEAGMLYSGQLGWAKTRMYWRINHMVAPKEEALGCLDCHGDNGRMDWKALGYKGDPMGS